MSDILLELFKEEAKINLTVLENGLIEGEQNGLETLNRSCARPIRLRGPPE